MQLFGYKEDATIIQAHVAGLLGRGGRPVIGRAEAARARYGGTTFIVIGRTHDPGFRDVLIPPVSEEHRESYVGYLTKSTDPRGVAPHEVLPLDFTPSGMDYPQDWSNAMSDKSCLLITMHVPAAFARGKNQLMKVLRSKMKNLDVREPWTFLQDKDVQEAAFKPRPKVDATKEAEEEEEQDEGSSASEEASSRQKKPRQKKRKKKQGQKKVAKKRAREEA
jgi:hypothetical protein